LLAQPELGLVDITKAQITLDSVRLNYVHGIWYEVSTQSEAVHQQQAQQSMRGPAHYVHAIGCACALFTAAGLRKQEQLLHAHCRC
jgi:hypothetical protein